MHKHFISVGSHRLGLTMGICALSVLITGSIALADIISSTFTTAKSNDVTITQLTIDKPASVASGDLLLASIAINGGNAAAVTAPAGWTQILRTDKDSNLSVISYWKIAGTSEPANYTWSIDHQTTAEGGIVRYTGVGTVNPIDVAADNTGYGITATTTSITTTAANEEIVVILGADVGRIIQVGGYFTPLSGMTEKYDVSNTPFGPSIALNDAIQTTAGATGSNTSTISGNKPRSWATQTIALRPTATVIATEDFESYAAGSSINGQNGGSGWAGGWVVGGTGGTYDVVSSPVEAGARAGHAVVGETGSGLAQRTIANPQQHVVLSVAIRQSTTNVEAGSGFEFLGITQTGNTAYSVRMMNGAITLQSAGGDIAVMNFDPNTWYIVELEIDAANHLNRARAKISGGAFGPWTNWVPSRGGTESTAVTTFRYDAAGHFANEFDGFIDSISIKSAQ